MKTFAVAIAISLTFLPLPAASSEDGEKWLTGGYRRHGIDFARALYSLDFSSKVFRSHLPERGQWVAFEAGRWDQVADETRAKIFAELGDQLDQLEPAALKRKQGLIRDWIGAARQLDACDSGEEFLAWAYSDPLTNPAFEWILARRQKSIGKSADTVAGTFSTAERMAFRSVLIGFLAKKSASERFRFFSRMFDKAAVFADRERAIEEQRNRLTYIEQGEDATSCFYYFFYHDQGNRIVRVRSVWNGGAQSKPTVTDYTFKKGIRIKNMTGRRSDIPQLLRGGDVGLETTSDVLLAGNTSLQRQRLEAPERDKTLTLSQRMALANLIGIFRDYPNSEPLPPRRPDPEDGN